MSLLTPAIISVFSLLVVIVSSLLFSFFLYKVNQKLTEVVTKGQSDALLIQELQYANDELKKQHVRFQKKTNAEVLESTQVLKQLEHRLKSQQEQQRNQHKLIENLQDNQEQDKLYTRAFKLAEKGADIEEIISECELPRAEAEMLLSVHRQRNSI